MLNIILLHIERKGPLKRNLATILPLKSKLSGKFGLFSAIDGSIVMLINRWIPKFQMTWKVFWVLNSDLPKGIYSASIKASYVSWTKIIEGRFTGVYRHLLSKCFENAVLGHLKMIQCKCIFWHQPETSFCLCCGSVFFIMLSVLSFAKWLMICEQNRIVK